MPLVAVPASRQLIMSSLAASFVTRTASRMYTTAAGTQQKAGIEALQAAAKEQGLKSTTYTATQLIAYVP